MANIYKVVVGDRQFSVGALMDKTYYVVANTMSEVESLMPDFQKDRIKDITFISDNVIQKERKNGK